LIPDGHVEIIDYRARIIERREFSKFLSRRFPFVNRNQIDRTRKLRAFLRKHSVVSPERCSSDDLEEARRFIIGQAYDTVIVGSDTVWRIRDDKRALPAPNVYFLPGIGGIKKIAFAVSFDQTRGDLIAGRVAHDLRKFIGDFDFISVRDEMSRQYLLELGLNQSQFIFMPDPTILWDFQPVVEVPEFLERFKPLVGLAVPEYKIRREITERLREKGFQVMNFMGRPVKGQLTLSRHYPINMRLGVYSLLDLMITDRFHGSLFTFKLGNCPVILLENVYKYPVGVISKGRDLFRRLGLESAVCRYDFNGPDWDFISRRISDWRKQESDVKERLCEMRDSGMRSLVDFLLE